MSSEGVKTILWSLVVVAALFPFEHVFPADPIPSRSARIRNLIYMPLVIMFSYGLQPYVNMLAATVLQYGSLLSQVSVFAKSDGWSVVVASLLFAFVWDVWQYWVHRLQHTSEYFWATHKFHHSETRLNATAHSRTHVASYILYVLLYTLMIPLIGAISPHWIVAFMMFRFWGYFIHANVRLRFGPLTPVISGPQWHRIHHSALKEHHNKNFATFFPVIDVMFGTYYRPGRDEFPPTGLCDEREMSFVRAATVEPLLIWSAIVRQGLARAFSLPRQRVPVARVVARRP
jgi:sterol desaturase/sphingolipid hydroxylase (fatty acid hydroxylase superfamily)